ncbi:MAG TPA: hypothetical protein ENH32_08730 [Proteobacteria bacterium]|nr:hypothetical protein BMS3Abin14_01681 [bacterium BMS3Abin14]HDL54045.1 hypothetical protein [Pseudomonadota bacterium]
MKIRTPLILVVLAAVFLLNAQAVPAEPPHDETWKVLSGPTIEVKYRGQSSDLAEDVLMKASQFLNEVSNLLGLPVGGPYKIFIAGSKEEFVSLQPAASSAPEWAGALTYPRYGVVILMTPGALGESGTQYWSLLEHEIVHLVMGEAENRWDVRFPRWLSEGVATFISGEMGIPRLLHLSWAEVTGSTIPFEAISVNFPEDPSRAEVAYAQSYLFVQYLMRRYGNNAVARLVTSFLEKGNMAQAVNGAYDISFVGLLNGFKQYARVKSMWVPVITSTASVWGLITLLFLYSYVGRRVRDYRTLSRWDDEEYDRNQAEFSEGENGDEGPPVIH